MINNTMANITMLNRCQVLVVLVGICLPFGLSAQSAHKHKRNADLFYDQGEYTVAEEEYRKANAAEAEAATTYNLANTIYQQERLEEAVRQYEQAAQMADDPGLRAKAYHNLGNTYMQAQQFDKSVESYINALKADPNDMDTKKNLTLALQQLKQQQQQQQQQQQENEQEDQEQEQEQQEQEQQQQSQEIEEPEDEQQPQEQQQQLSEEEAEELLRIIENEDQRVQGKLRKGDKEKRKPKKDW